MGEKENSMSREIILRRNEGGWIVAECPELPGCVSQGRDEAEATANIQEAVAAWLWAEEQKSAEAQS
jgi:predicted RNase H-like HicB family nuclease